LPDMSMREVRSAGNMSARAAATLVCSKPPLALVPSRMRANFRGRHDLALYNHMTHEVSPLGYQSKFFDDFDVLSEFKHGCSTIS